MGRTFFPQIFMKIAIEPNSDVENSKIKLIFPIFFIYTFIFALISQKYLKKWVNFFSQIFMKIAI